MLCSSLNKTFLLQKRAIRSINRAAYNSHTDPLFKTSKILKLHDLYILQACLFTYDFERKQLPTSFTHYFRHTHDIHPHIHTRQSHLIHETIARNTFIANLPQHKISHIWNQNASNIDIILLYCGTKCTFWALCHSLCLLGMLVKNRGVKITK